MLIFKGEELPEYNMLYEKATTKKNGVVVSVTLRSSYGERDNCIKAIREQLSYLENVYYDVPGFDNKFQIFKNDLFQWNSLNPTPEMHISLKNIYYPINWAKLGIQRINIPVALRFDDYEDLQPVFNREELIWSAKAVDAVKAKLAKLSEWMVEKYNENVQEIPSLFQAWDLIGVPTHNITLKHKLFDVTVLEQFSSVKFKEVIIKELKHFTPVFYKRNLQNLIRGHRIICENQYGTLRVKNIYANLGSCMNYRSSSSKKIILLDDGVTISGFFRDYLKTQSFNYLVKTELPEELDKEDDIFWDHVLGTKGMGKKDRDERINEFKRIRDGFMSEFLTDGTKMHQSKEYLDFWEKSKAARKAAPKKAALNKKPEDVTIAYARAKANNGGWMFEKKAFPLDTVHKFPHITVFLDETEAAQIDDLAPLYVTQNLRFATIGVLERKKINKLKENKNIMTLAEIEATKVYSKVVTAIKAQQLLTIYNELVHAKIEIVQTCMKKFSTLRDEVYEYVGKNMDHRIHITNNAVAVAMVKVAETNNLWDPAFIGKVREFEAAIDDYKFIRLLKEPTYRDSISVGEEYQKLVSSLMLFTKLKYENKLTNMEICVKKGVPLKDKAVAMAEII